MDWEKEDSTSFRGPDSLGEGRTLGTPLDVVAGWWVDVDGPWTADPSQANTGDWYGWS